MDKVALFQAVDGFQDQEDLNFLLYNVLIVLQVGTSAGHRNTRQICLLSRRLYISINRGNK